MKSAATKTAKAIETKAAELAATAAKTTDKGLASLYRDDASGLRSVAEYLRAGKTDLAVGLAYSLETGCRDHFPEDFWRLGVQAGLIEARQNGRRVLYAQITN